MTAPVLARAAAGSEAVSTKKAATVVSRAPRDSKVGLELPAVKGPKPSPKSGGKVGLELPNPVSAGGKAGAGALGALGNGGNSRRVLVAEFLVCAAILLLAPLSPKHQGEQPTAWMKRGASIVALFFILGLISSGGPKAAKVAAGAGGLVTLALLLASRDIWAALASRFNGGSQVSLGDDVDADGDGNPNFDLISPLPGGLPDGSGINGSVDAGGLNPSGGTNPSPVVGNTGGLGPGGQVFQPPR